MEWSTGVVAIRRGGREDHDADAVGSHCAGAEVEFGGGGGRRRSVDDQIRARRSLHCPSPGTALQRPSTRTQTPHTLFLSLSNTHTHTISIALLISELYLSF